jgi:hypothetical protein
MGMPSMPKTPALPNPPPRVIDPTVMFARLREKQKALMAQGRNSTILSANAPLSGLSSSATTPRAY